MKIRTPIPPLVMIDKRKKIIPYVLGMIIALLIAAGYTMAIETIRAKAGEREAVEKLLDCWNGKWVGESGNEDLACMPLVRNKKR